MSTLTTVWARIAAASLLLFPGYAAAQADHAAGAPFKQELTKQERIYRDKVEGYAAGYVTNRTLDDYVSALPAEFDRSLAALGARDRWLDIGAGMGQAILDYYSPAYDLSHPDAAKPMRDKASAVAMSIEDRRNVFWKEAAAHLQPGQIRYLHDRRLREYSAQELGRFQLVTDVIGGFSYATDLSLFVQKVLSLLNIGGTFYTLLQDVRSEAGTNTPYYEDSTFLTEISDDAGADVRVCAWLKSIRCVKVTCELRADWKPPIEVYGIRKVCEDVAVPPLEPVRFAAGTPPERAYRLSGEGLPLMRKVTAQSPRSRPEHTE